ncbi:SDR family NAD(P)-dependent oxidoreductase [Polymorphobacter arshaanensis]|uniref:SDR family NAD(P)-dependent oxidoreductase n=1 Tax=Glacieibacterium arshaanense TaxID=2511025 RepID=A0A4Y9ERU0_9SPHN|nr:SDR family NAD(P)-dependent oxidoreductase [Polymorphobacter arshaanensis]TFU06346.1 SDR family NAD(P)-dependent oxidoreductase [Polymorphobacter arshaanensis]
MPDHVSGKSIVITGAGSGFGRLVAAKAATRGAKVTLGDINAAALDAAVAEIRAQGGAAQAVVTDVTDLTAMKALVAAAVQNHDGIDVMVNNAGVMPLAFYADHAAAYDAWVRCIDINFKGVLNGMVAAYDAMIAAGQGQMVNVSSIYGNYPTVGAAVYGATKAAVNVLGESLRLEARGKIKVTTVKPTGVFGTGLGGTVVNGEGLAGILGGNAAAANEVFAGLVDGTIDPARVDPEGIDYVNLDPRFIADAIIYAIDQPWGVSIGEVTVRAAGDYYIL